eukprot:8060217-Pyramimonas_sp.AAC.1
MAMRWQLRSSNVMHPSRSHPRLHLGQTFEHCERTDLRHDPPGLCAFPGRRFSARVGHVGPAFQQPPRIEKLLA